MACLSWSHRVVSFTVAIMTWLTVIEYMCHKWSRICSTCRKHSLVLSSFMTCHGWPLWNICVTNDHGYVPLVVTTSRSFPHSRLITGFVARLTRRVPLMEQELLTLREYMSSPPVFCGVRFTRYLVLCVCFVDRCLSFCPFSFGHCIVCPLIYGFWLPLWFFKTLLISVLSS